MTNSRSESRKFRRVVLIDDNRASNFLHQCLLEELLVTEEIVVLQDGLQALNFFTSHREMDANAESGQDLILLDVNMPVMDGWELLDKLVSTNRDYLHRNAVVMLTSFAHEHDAARARLLTVKGYLEKPLDEEKVAELLLTI